MANKKSTKKTPKKTSKKTSKTSSKKTKKKTSPQTEVKDPLLSTEMKIRASALIWLFLLVMAFYGNGAVGGFLHNIFAFLFGNMFTMVCGFLLTGYVLVYMLIKAKFPRISTPEGVGIVLIFLATLILYCYDEDVAGLAVINSYIDKAVFNGGGFIGYFLYGILSAMFASTGALWAGILMITIGIIFISTRMIIKYQKYVTVLDEQEEEKVPLKKPKFFNFDEKKDSKNKKDDFLFPEEAFDEPAPNPQKPIKTKKPKAEPKVEPKAQPEIVKEVKPAYEPIKVKKTEKPKDLKPLEIPKPVKTKNGEYQLPSYELLNPIPDNEENKDEMHNAAKTGQRLEELLKQFGVNVHVEDLQIGPTVTKYELRLEIGTRVSKILSLQDDIQLALAAKDIRIEAPIPGKPFVGIEVPNKTASMVPYNEIFQMHMREKAWNNKLAVPLGKDVSGQLITAELDKMPHLLIAGATGSGKSVCVNSIITSLLMKATPEEVRLILVDPKKVELSNYNGVPHLLSPVVTDPKKAAGVLQEVVMEMERRYEVFATNNKRNIGSYNKFAKDFNKTAKEGEEKEIMPYIVVILDEVADLMMVASKTVEDCIMRLAQMARAAGIHMIVATQRPSTDIITGVIKANIPSRIAFAVSSSIDSRTILDTSGAEKLLGKGDMLFSPMGASSPIRVQGAYVGDDEVARVVDFVSHQMEATYDEKYVNAKVQGSIGEASGDDEEDEEYEECRAFVIQAQKASTSLLQRRFRIGYNKAARIIEQLEENGVIGPANGSKPREVYIKTSEQEEM